MKRDQTHCIQDHAFDEVNTYFRPDGSRQPYDIVSDRDLKQAASKLEGYLGNQRTDTRDGHKTGTVAPENVFPAALADCKLLKDLVSRAGLEPATTALKVRCSTN
jgi:hypothetical protein